VTGITAGSFQFPPQQVKIPTQNIQEHDSTFPIVLENGKKKKTATHMESDEATVRRRRGRKEMHSCIGGAQTARMKVNELLELISLQDMSTSR
jgi:hypothetical protein